MIIAGSFIPRPSSSFPPIAVWHYTLLEPAYFVASFPGLGTRLHSIGRLHYTMLNGKLVSYSYLVLTCSKLIPIMYLASFPGLGMGMRLTVCCTTCMGVALRARLKYIVDLSRGHTLSLRLSFPATLDNTARWKESALIIFCCFPIASLALGAWKINKWSDSCSYTLI